MYVCVLIAATPFPGDEKYACMHANVGRQRNNPLLEHICHVGNVNVLNRASGLNNNKYMQTKICHEPMS